MTYLNIRTASIIVAGTILFASFGSHATDMAPSGIPRDVHKAFSRSLLSNKYVLISWISPASLQGDFDGDRQLDTAVFVKEKTTNKIGISIVHGGVESVVVIGAGRIFGNGGDDFSWMDAWRVYSKGSVARSADASAPPTLKGDAILVMKTMSASALVYWTGNEYGWYQQGD